MQIEQILKKIVQAHSFNGNEGFSCLIPDKKPFPSNEGLLLWYFSESRIETKVQLFHSPARIQRMVNMLDLPEKEYIKLFTGYLDNYLKALKKVGFEPIGKGLELFGKTKTFNVKVDFDMLEKKPSMLKEFELLTINNPLVKFAEDRGYFKCTHKDKLVVEDGLGERSSSKKSRDSDSKKNDSKRNDSKKNDSKKKVSPSKVSPSKKEVVIPSKQAKQKSSPPKTKPKTPVVTDTKGKKEEKHGGLKSKFQKIAQKNLTVDWEGRKTLFVKQTGELYKKVQGWLAEYSKQGHLSCRLNKLTLTEEYLGNYEVEALEVNIGGHGVIFQPVEMNFLGTLGRIDLYRRGYKAHKVMLLLTQDSKKKLQWEVWKDNRDKVSFTKESLEALFAQWLDY